MQEIPSELYGVPAGAAIIAVVEALKQAGLPGQYAGLAAILIATVVGTAFLMANGQAWEVALGKGLVWGFGLVAVHYSTIRPLAQTTTTATPPPALVKLDSSLVDGHTLPPA